MVSHSAALTLGDGEAVLTNRGNTRRRAIVLLSPRECQCKASVSADSCCVAASLPDGSTADLGVFEGVTRKPVWNAACLMTSRSAEVLTEQPYEVVMGSN